MSQLQRSLPKRHAQAKRMVEYRAAKRAIEMEQQARQLQQQQLQQHQQQQLHQHLQLQQQQRRQRTPNRSRSRSRSHSRSRSRTGSQSPDLICIDDTENEDSPEKPNEIPAANLQHQQQKVASKTPPPFALQLEIQSEAEATPAENGSVLDEFLTIKPAIAAEPVIEEAAGCNNSQQQQLQELQDLELPALKPQACLDMVVEDATLKRRRSVTPPAVEAHNEKRTKSLPTEDLDDEVIELTPYAEPVKQAQPTPTPLTLQQTPTAPPTTPLHKPTNRTNVEPLNAFKAGAPYSLSPSSGIEYYAQKKAICQQHQAQTQPENMASISFSLETPSPSTEPMEVVFINQKQLDAQNVKADVTVLAQTGVQQQQQQQQQPTIDLNSFVTPYTLQQQSPQAQQQPPQLPQVQQQLLQQPQQLQQNQQPQPPPQPQSPRPKQRVAESKQTQTLQGTSTRNKSSVDMNNTNSDAVFHQRVKDLYTELDEIMSDKVRAVKPELKSYGEEKLRIEADLKTLDSLIYQKEEEHNRLLHLRSIKEELLARIERKERILIMKEILPSILNKNCSTSELYEMHSLLHSEQNAPMPSKYGVSALEQMINRVENGLDDIKILRGALGLQNKASSLAELSMPPPPPQHCEAVSQQRRDSLPAMRSSSLPNHSTVYARSSGTRDDYKHEQLEELSKRNKPPSRYQQLINESKQLTGSTADLAASSTYRQQQPIDTQQRSQTHSLDNNRFDNEVPLKPLFNSSPLGANQQRKSSDTTTQLSDLHSMYRSDLLHGLDSLDRAVNQTNRNTINNRSKRLSVATNGPDLEVERRCQYCERFKATYMCASCQNQWYCSRECQVRAWDTHWESCPN
ncbi:mediator of RNA polymerase II transcription subunit 15 isoform X2 [Drosophila hydei]|nr:mediator of RNA polymerase II transcription subunit 15 isoform X2 [Drosophila hydei]